MRLEGLRSQTGYRRRPGKYGGKPAVASPNLLKRQFDAAFSTPWAAVAPLLSPPSLRSRFHFFLHLSDQGG
jgi:hypothetical protein